MLQIVGGAVLLCPALACDQGAGFETDQGSSTEGFGDGNNTDGETGVTEAAWLDEDGETGDPSVNRSDTGSPPSQFGHAGEPAAAPTFDTRPLLVILLAKDSATPLRGDERYYRERIFGPSDPNVASYYSAISKDRFNYVEADVVSVVDNFDPDFLARAGATGAVGVQATRLRSLMLADDAGFDFSAYDEDGDGTLRTDELAVLTIDNYSEGAGTTGTPPCVGHDGLQVCTSVALAGHRSMLMNYAHELAHQLGAGDLYGSNCLSQGATLMACTGTSGTEADDTWHLDPWHRAELGWTASGVVGGSSGSVALSPVSTITGPFSSPGKERLTFQRPGTNERLIFEHRRRVGAYDEDVSREGIVVWWVDTNGSGALNIIPGLDSGADASLFTLAPVGCHGDPNDEESRGRTAPGYAPGSSYRFRWSDGADTGMLFTIGDLQANGTMSVSWSTSYVATSCPEPSALPDLVVESISGAGCSGTGGVPVVRVDVKNAGEAAGRGWVDVFTGFASPPSIGTYSLLYRMSPWLEAGESTTMWFNIEGSWENRSAWVDVLLDTSQSTDESMESNNHKDRYLSFPDCSFN